MDRPFFELRPRLFPVGFEYLVAPFWEAVDIERGTGDVSYQAYFFGSPILETVNTFISNTRGFTFNGRWMLLTQWNGVSGFAAPNEASINYKT